MLPVNPVSGLGRYPSSTQSLVERLSYLLLHWESIVDDGDGDDRENGVERVVQGGAKEVGLFLKEKGLLCGPLCALV